jgi:hypothetical protein
MPRTVRPQRPLPARVYWRRRLVVLGVPLLLVLVLARVLGGSSDARDDAAGTAARTGAEVAPTTAPTVGPTRTTTSKGKQGTNKKKRKNKKTEPPEPVLAEPTGPCADSDVVATPALTSAPGGSPVAITVNLRTVVTEACTWRASARTMTVTITSGNDYIWSSRECPASIPAQDVVVRQAVDAPVTVTWSARRSDETCSKWTDYALPGFYHAESAALGGEPTDVQFELVAPQPGVVTQTAKPKQGGAKGQKDTSHTAGEDGAGNSAG